MELSEWVLCAWPTLSCLVTSVLLKPPSGKFYRCVLFFFQGSMSQASPWNSLCFSSGRSCFFLWSPLVLQCTTLHRGRVLLFKDLFIKQSVNAPHMPDTLLSGGAQELSGQSLLVSSSSSFAISTAPTRLEGLWGERPIQPYPLCLTMPLAHSGSFLYVGQTHDW